MTLFVVLQVNLCLKKLGQLRSAENCCFQVWSQKGAQGSFPEASRFKTDLPTLEARF
jgi:hypothetical protein